MHLVCTPTGVPVSFSLLPASYHDSTPIHELTCELPSGANVYGDKAYNSAHDESTIEADTLVKLVPIRRANMLCNSWDEKQGLRENRHQVESLNSQLERMGVERLYSRTLVGFELKLHASLLAVIFTNSY